MKLISASQVIGNVARRFFSPRQHLQFWRCLFSDPKSIPKSATDGQLYLYSQILPGEFLNYGFFENAPAPEDMSINQIHAAQIRYTENILERIEDKTSPILDAGCGMGGLSAMATARGLNITALTPNNDQAASIATKHPTIPLVREKLEKFNSPAKFGTVITSESFQYMKMQQAMETISNLLLPNGTWILCDYFRLSETARSGHSWNAFQNQLAAAGWRITYERDITPNVLPTLAYVQMWGRRLAIPVIDFSCRRFKRKHPAGYHLAQDVITDLNSKLAGELEKISPETFAREKKYMLLTLKR